MLIQVDAAYSFNYKKHRLLGKEAIETIFGQKWLMDIQQWFLAPNINLIDINQTRQACMKIKLLQN